MILGIVRLPTATPQAQGQYNKNAPIGLSYLQSLEYL
jgi:hypothetical protein